MGAEPIPASLSLALATALALYPAAALGGGGNWEPELYRYRIVIADHLGSNQLVSSWDWENWDWNEAGHATSGGEIVSRRLFDPFGKQLAEIGTESGVDRARYTDQPEETWGGAGAIYDFGARWYDAEIGRFLSPDPVLEPYNPQSLDAYQFVRNNPLNFIDPTGLTSEEVPLGNSYIYHLVAEGLWPEVALSLPSGGLEAGGGPLPPPLGNPASSFASERGRWFNGGVSGVGDSSGLSFEQQLESVGLGAIAGVRFRGHFAGFKSQSGLFSGIQQRFQEANEIAARSQFSADPFGTLIFPPEGEAGPPQFIPGNASAGGLEFIAGPLRGLSAGRALIRGKEALGFLPSKIGGGGKLQPFSRLTGQFVPFAKTFEGRLLALSTSNAGSLTAGAAQGVLSGISGADLPPAITTRQRIGQIGGQIAAPLIGPFIGF